MKAISRYINAVLKSLITGIVLLIPILINLKITSSSGFNIFIKISASDLLLMAASITLLLKILLLRDFKTMRMPEVPFSLFLVAILLSIGQAVSPVNFLKEFVQILFSFYAFYVVLLNSTLSISDIKTLINVLTLSSASLILFGCFQYYYLGNSPYFVRSLFENRSIFGAYSASTLPLVFVVLLTSRSIYVKILSFMVLQVAFFSILSFGHVLALTAAMLVISFCKNRRVFYYTSAVVGFNILLLLAVVDDSRTEFRKFISPYESSNIAVNIRRVWFYNNVSTAGIFLTSDWAGYQISLGNNYFIPDSLTRQDETDAFFSFDGKVLKQYNAEGQAALNLLAEFPFTGCGLGNYQDQIGKFYQSLEKNNTSEPNANNGYLIIASSTGIVGLWAFITLLWLCGKRLFALYRDTGDDYLKNISLGLAGSLVALTVSNFFTHILVSQLTTLFALIIFLSAHLNEFRYEQK
jgi:hypothetical protein